MLLRGIQICWKIVKGVPRRKRLKSTALENFSTHARLEPEKKRPGQGGKLLVLIPATFSSWPFNKSPKLVNFSCSNSWQIYEQANDAIHHVQRRTSDEVPVPTLAGEVSRSAFDRPKHGKRICSWRAAKRCRFW